MSKTFSQNIALFFRYNTVALFATTIDFVCFFLLFEMFDFWYVLSASISASLGGIAAFIMNWKWVFKTQKKRWYTQFIKYVIAWGGSILLNIYGLYFLVENTEISEVMSKIMVSIIVGAFYNFLISKNIIFK
tara:strand:- start:31581 stop:31976 length:396 start_codon:yes stop_codon:yes gene_type:complete